MEITVRPLPSSSGHLGHISFGGRETLPCALGRSGVRQIKREGDGATPMGRFRILYGYYRPDRRQRPRTGVPMVPLKPHWGWCDDPEDRAYNQRVELPYPASCETLWRTDGLYDVFFVLNYNTGPIHRGKGSAIFLHCAEGQGSTLCATQGCIALAYSDLSKKWSLFSPRVTLHVGGSL